MKKIARILSVAIVLSLVISVFPASTFAETETTSAEPVPVEEQQPAADEAAVVSETDNEESTEVQNVEQTSATYTVTTSVNYKSRGSITATSTVKANGSKTINVTAKSGYYLKALKVDGVSVGAKYTYTLENINKDYQVKAVFAKCTKIMIDAGHYANYNRSPVYKAYYESRAMWDLHEYLKAELETYNGFQVDVTRSNEEKDLNVYYRGTAGKGYDLLVSLHSNASSTKSTDYPLIITQKGYTKDELAQSLGKVIYNTMGTNQNYKVQQRLNSDGATEYYGVLRGAKAVGTKAFIIEHSFHTNYAAAKWLYDRNNLKAMAVAEAAVIADYYGLSKLDNSQTNAGTSDSTATEEKEVVTSTDKVKVLVGDLNIRENYNATSNIMGIAEKNAVYQLKAKTKDGYWGQLSDNGYWIYLKGGYTEVVTETATETPEEDSDIITSTEKVKVLVSDLNMRKSYTSSSKSMGKAKKNTTYQLQAKTKDGKWGQLKTNGYWIYLKGGYTKVVTSTASTTTTTTTTTESKVVSSTEKVKVLVSDLNMRKSYTSSSKSMGKAKKNTTYQLKAKTSDGKWGQLKTNGYWIYLKGGYTKVVTSTASTTTASSSKVVASTEKVKVTVSELNMRKSYSSSSKSMGKAKKNTTYQLKAKTSDGKWGQLKTNGYWIYLKGYTKSV